MGVMGTAELAAKVRGEEESAEKKLEALDNPRLAEQYTFLIEHVDKRGRKFSGQFTNSILNAFRKSQVSALCARLAQGLPFESLPVDGQLLIRKLAHLEISLGPKRPKWAEDLGQIVDEDLIDKLYEEALEHERIFRGYDAAEKDRAADDADDRGDHPAVG